MRSAAVLHHRVDLIDDHRPRAPEQGPPPLGREEQVERLGRRDQDVGRRPHHRLPLPLRRVAGADGSRDLRVREAHRLQHPTDLATRLGEVLVDVVREGLER